MTNELPNNIDEHRLRTPELSDYIELLACLEKLEMRVRELERWLLNHTDGTLH